MDPSPTGQARRRMLGILRWRYLLLSLVAVGWATWPFIRANNPHFIPGDYYEFMYGGRILIGLGMPHYHSGILHLYDQNPGFQVGPAPLVLVGVLSLLPGTAGLAVWMALTMACGLITLRATELVLRTTGLSRGRAAGAVLVLGVGMLGCWSALTSWSHLEDGIAIACMVLSVAAITRHRPWWIPALLIGFGASCKPWGLAGVAFLLAVPKTKQLRALAVALVAAGILWVPFIAAAPHTLSAVSSLPSQIYPNSALRGLGFDAGRGAPSGARTMEVLLGAAMAALAVRRRRLFAAPLAALAGRFLLEPRWFVYYGAGYVATALLWDLSSQRRLPIWTVVIVIVEYPIQEWGPSHLASVLHLILLISVLVAVMLRTPASPVMSASASESSHEAAWTSVQS